MKIFGVALLALTLLVGALKAAAFDTSSNQLSIFSQTQPAPAHSSVIKGIQVFGKSSGIAYTNDALYRTDDNGETWTELPLRPGYSLRLASVRFSDEKIGIALFADHQTSTLVRYDTMNGGDSWFRVEMGIDQSDIRDDLTNADLDSARLNVDENGGERLEFRLATSSNFDIKVHYYRKSAESAWAGRRVHQVSSGDVERFESLHKFWNDAAEAFPGNIEAKNLPTDPVVAKHVTDPHARSKVHSDWYLTQGGSCAGFKSGCVQTSRLYRDVSIRKGNLMSVAFKEITPSELIELNTREKEAARLEADQNRMFAAPPGGATRISLNRGFDKCTNGTVAQMRLWWDYSYFFDANIYMSGRNRGCSQTLTAAWVDQVSAMGWGLIPTIVGYQSPCSVCTTCAKHSTDPATAETQGRGEADIAVTDANNLGLTAGSVLYYDMERYDETVSTPGCRMSTTAFLKGWTERIRELGYVSGVYGSPRNAIDDWQFMPPSSRMDAVWMARWDNIPSVWTYVSFANFPTNVWANSQRIKQWQAPHNETWGGVTFNIDGNIADGPVAGVPVPRNKVADFDGDQKTDISVFRPSTGEWFVAGTRGPSYNVYQFGTAEDLPANGDYDGDGLTDLAVFRPSNSTWYFRGKNTYNVRQYGEPGDIPAPADYNGDRRTDIAVFRPSTGVWYIALSDSLNSFVQTPFGQDGDRPAVGDYDGDGRADIAVWRPSNFTWYVLGSTVGYTVVEWGVAGDVPAQGDYDGDGKTDRAVFRPSAGTWHLLKSTEGIFTQQFGVSGDTPVTGDYDGDGRYDVSVFRPSDGTWYMSQSQGGYVVRQFGVADDKPIPKEYLPR